MFGLSLIHILRIFEVYDSLPAQLAKDAKKFQYKLIKSGARASQYGDAIDWLIRAGIVNKCMKCSQEFYPVAAYQDVSAVSYTHLDVYKRQIQRQGERPAISLTVINRK